MFQAGGLGDFFTSVSAKLTAVQLYFRLSAVSFQLTGGTHEAFSVQNCLVFFFHQKPTKYSLSCFGTYRQVPSGTKIDHTYGLEHGTRKIETCGPSFVVVELEWP